MGNEGMIRERREGGGTEPAMRIGARNYFAIFLKCPAPCSDVSSIFCLYLQCGVCSPDFFFLLWMKTSKCGVGGRGGKDGSPVVLSVSIRYFLHMCCYINKEYGVTIPELGK